MFPGQLVLLSACLFCRGAHAAELLCHRNTEMSAANANRSFPDNLRAFVWSDENKCILSAGGGTKYSACHWEANVTAAVSWVVEETLQGHIDAVCAVAWSSDGSYVLTGSADNTARIWKAPAPLGNASDDNYTYDKLVRGETRKAFTGVEPVAILRGHSDTVRAVAFSPDSTRIITGSADGTVRAWQAPDENATKIVEIVENNTNDTTAGSQLLIIDSALFQPENCSITNNCSVANTSSSSIASSPLEPSPFYGGDGGGWTLSAYLPATGDVVWAVAWPQKSRVLVGAVDRTACVWSPPATKSRRTEEVSLVACTPEEVGTRWRSRGDSVLRDSYDRTARIWFARWSEQSRFTPQWRMEARLQDRHMHSHLVTVAAWSPDGTKLLTGSRDGIVRVWHTGEAVEGIGKDPTQWNVLGTLKGHTDVIWAVAWSPDSACVLSGGRDKVTHIWKPSATLPYQWEVAATLQEIKCLFTIDHEVKSIFYAGVNMTDNVTGDFLDWEKDKGLTITVVPGAWLVITGYNNQPRSCSTGGFAITCTNGVTSADPRWEAFGSNVSIDGEHRSGGGVGWSSPCKSNSRFSLTADRFAKKLYASDDNYAAFRIRLATQEALGLDFVRRRSENSGHSVSSANVGVRADGTKDGLIGELQRQFIASPEPVGKYSFRPEGEVGYFPAAWVAAWSPDGRKVMLGSRDGSVRVWRLHAHSPMQWKLEATLRGHTGIVWSIAWSPDSRRALTAGHDGLVRIWRTDDIASGDVGGTSSEDVGGILELVLEADPMNLSNMSNVSLASSGILGVAADDMNFSNLSNLSLANSGFSTVGNSTTASLTSSNQSNASGILHGFGLTSSPVTTKIANWSNVSNTSADLLSIAASVSTSVSSTSSDISNITNDTANATASL